MVLMVAGAAKNLDDEETPVEGIRKMNAMVKSLINKWPIDNLRKWDLQDGANKFLLELPKDVGIIVKYIQDFNIFLFPRKNLYGSLNVYMVPLRFRSLRSRESPTN